MERLTPAGFPPLLADFLLTLLMSFLLGLGLREYYLLSHKTRVFGTTRTCAFIGIFGFVLFRLQAGGWLYLGGLLVLGLLLSLYYHAKLAEQQIGLIGILMALLSYLTGPIALSFPYWYVILFTITALFLLNAKEKIRLLTERMANEEIISLAKFLVLSGVILPLTPKEPMAPFIPVSPHQTWTAVVVVSGISYLGYLLQTYLLQGRGLLLTGAIGGIYSSTATTVVTARQSQYYPWQSTEPAAAIILATAVMYPRLLVIIFIFDPPVGMALSGPFLGLAALAGLAALLLHRRNHGEVAESRQPIRAQNPLELSSALLFAFLFVVLSAASHYVLAHFPRGGLQWMSLVAGLADIDPFVLSLLQGHLSASAVGKGIVIATASNNLLKAVYAGFLGSRQTAIRACSSLGLLAILSLGVGLVYE